MKSKEDLLHLKRIKQVSYKLNIPEEVIEQALFYTSEYIKNKLSAYEINHDTLLSKEEFNKNLPIIYVAPLGWFKPNYNKYKAIHLKAKEVKERNKNGEQNN